MSNESQKKKIITRFAPSPTGALHVGGARTALFNWAFARHHGGEFILRIEDTDKTRSTENNTRGLIRDLAWLGLDWDQGPAMPKRGDGGLKSTGRQAASGTHSNDEDDGRDARPTDARPTENQIGENGPYFQSQRGEIYESYLEKLQAKGLVYEDDGALRFKMPKHNITVHDLILGAVTMEADQTQMQDFIIYKSDKAGGGPTFHFANIIDDFEMGVTHVIRGQEHLNNTVKHLALAEALEIEAPQYAHIPLIFNPDGSKMSKRDKAKAARDGIKKTMEGGKQLDKIISEVAEEAQLLAEMFPSASNAKQLTENSPELFQEFVDGKNDEEFIASHFAHHLNIHLPEIDVRDFHVAGYLPDVLINYLALLGWNPGNDVEDFGDNPLEFLKENFSLERVQKSAAKFDRQKLLHFNGEAIARMDSEQFRKKLHIALSNQPEFRDPQQLEARRYNQPTALRLSEKSLILFAQAYQPRVQTLNDPAEQGAFFVQDLKAEDYDLSIKPVKKMLRDKEQVMQTLETLQQRFDDLTDWGAETIEKVIEDYATENEIKMGTVAQPIRVAVAGGPVSPPIGITLTILGKQKTLNRIGQFQLLLKQSEEN